MNLPFLKQRAKDSGMVAPVERISDKSKEQDEDSDAALHSAAQDMLRAFESKDFKHLAQALRAAHQILDSEDAPQSDEGEQAE